MCRAIEEMCEKAVREAEFKTRKSLAVGVYKEYTQDIGTIARLTGLSEQVVAEVIQEIEYATACER